MPEIVDMPVGTPERPQMMSDTSPEAPGTKGATEVEVERRIELNAPKAPDVQFDRRN